MTAEEARTASNKTIERQQKKAYPLIQSRIEYAAARGKKHLLCRSNKPTRERLKSDGFGIIFIGNITLIRW